MECFDVPVVDGKVPRLSRRPIRVLHVLHTFSTGGLENGVVNLINHSPDHVIHELCFLSSGGEFLARLERPVVYHELHKRDGNDVRTLFRLRQLFQSRAVDIVHTRNWAAFDGVLAACLTRKPIVVHGEHGRDISDPEGTVKRRNIARRALSFRTRRFVAVSRNLYDWLHATVRVPEAKLVFIPNGVDTERFQPRPQNSLRKELGIGEDEFVVGTVGRLDPVKNHECLIETIRDLNAASSNKVRLVIVGDGPRRSHLEKMLEAFPVSPKPLLIGFRPDVENVYAAFDVFALTSFAEGMSNTLLEAMACGLPVVCTAVGGNVELVEDRKHGTLVPPGDKRALANAFVEYMISPERRRTDGANARRFVVDHFSLPRMVDRYVRLYESVALCATTY
jgi:sugar transferase (PEP-CTERM/EpsH1 system associated)